MRNPVQVSTTTASAAAPSSNAASTSNPPTAQDKPGKPHKPTPPPKQRIDAKLLIPGHGSPIPHASLIFAGPKIISVGPTADLAVEDARLAPTLVTPILMPGLWDVHVHFYGQSRYSMDDAFRTGTATIGARIARDLVATLNSGYTSVRELGGYGHQVRAVVEEGWLPGPNIWPAVGMLSPTAGHADAVNVPLCAYHEATDGAAGPRGIPAALCDGPDECVKAVRTQIRQGAKTIKIAVSGGAADDGDDMLDVEAQHFSDAEIVSVVAEAGRHSMAVAAHCDGKRSIMAALRCGCTTIEHASYLDDEAIWLMRQKGAILVATRGIIAFAVAHPELFTKGRYEKLKRINSVHKEAYRKAIAAGIRCALGTDVLASTDKIGWRHGMGAAEIKYAVEAGMTPLKAIEAATANGPLTLGPRAPKSGQLREGFDADFLALDVNPLDDVRVLEKQSNIRHVWKGGKRVKRDGKPIGILPDDE